MRYVNKNKEHENSKHHKGWTVDGKCENKKKNVAITISVSTIKHALMFAWRYFSVVNEISKCSLSVSNCLFVEHALYLELCSRTWPFLHLCSRTRPFLHLCSHTWPLSSFVFAYMTVIFICVRIHDLYLHLCSHTRPLSSFVFAYTTVILIYVCCLLLIVAPVSSKQQQLHHHRQQNKNSIYTNNTIGINYNKNNNKINITYNVRSIINIKRTTHVWRSLLL